jgi:hypothetical protein
MVNCCTDEIAAQCADGFWLCGEGAVEDRFCVGFLDLGTCGGEPDAGTLVHWSDCAVPSDCTLVANSCCGQCGVPTLDGMDAVNRLYTNAHYAEVCPVPQPCPDCPVGANPELFATCSTVSGRCAGIDLGTSTLTECNTDLDCTIRVPDCCECGADTSPWRLIALRQDQESAYASLVCDPLTGCAECEPTYPDDVRAVCGADGHCEVEVGPPM